MLWHNTWTHGLLPLVAECMSSAICNCIGDGAVSAHPLFSLDVANKTGGRFDGYNYGTWWSNRYIYRISESGRLVVSNEHRIMTDGYSVVALIRCSLYYTPACRSAFMHSRHCVIEHSQLIACLRTCVHMHAV